MLMKTVLALLMLAIVSLSSAQGQGPFEFSPDLQLLEPRPPHTERWGGSGVFTLQGNTLSYRVAIIPWGPQPEAAIRYAGPDGPVIFDLALLGCQTGFGTNLGLCVFKGAAGVADSDIPDLLANNWFVTASYHDLSGEVRYAGRIEVVPEPRSLSVLSLSLAVAGVWCWLRPRNHHERPDQPCRELLGGRDEQLRIGDECRGRAC